MTKIVPFLLLALFTFNAAQAQEDSGFSVGGVGELGGSAASQFLLQDGLVLKNIVRRVITGTQTQLMMRSFGLTQVRLTVDL